MQISVLIKWCYYYYWPMVVVDEYRTDKKSFVVYWVWWCCVVVGGGESAGHTHKMGSKLIENLLPLKPFWFMSLCIACILYILLQSPTAREPATVIIIRCRRKGLLLMYPLFANIVNTREIFSVIWNDQKEEQELYLYNIIEWRADVN